ncbi:MAG TPA: DUF6622 family protein [Telluria sp.]
MMQMLTHTPVFVWAILAFLIFRGVLAARDRQVTVRRLFIIPAVMLAMTLQDLALRWGLAGATLLAWSAGVLASALAMLAFTRTNVVAGMAPGSILLRGSWAPLAVMLAVFAAKYAAIVSLVLHPQLRQDALFAAAFCAMCGVFNGYFLGSLVRDLKACMALRGHLPTTIAA